MLQRILVATDFSQAARTAVDRAALLARQHGAMLKLVHAVPQRGLLERALGHSKIDHRTVIAGAEHALRVETGRLVDSGIDATCGLAEEPLPPALERARETFRADLVVLGARGASEREFRGGALGSHSTGCYAAATYPLLIARRPVEGGYLAVVAAVEDFDGSRDVFAWALEIMNPGSICDVVHAFDAPFVDRLRMLNLPSETIEAYTAESRFTAERNVSALIAMLGAAQRARPFLVQGAPRTAVLDTVLKREPDVVVVGRSSRHRHGGARAVDSIGLSLARESRADLLVVP